MSDGWLQICQCPRCGVTILAGWAEGLFWRADPYPLSIEDATVIKRYGIQVLVVDRPVNTWLAAAWQPGQYDLTRPNRHLLAPHVCGSAHALQEPE